MKLECINPTLEVEISEIDATLDEIILYIQKRYGNRWKFNRTELRYGNL